MSRARAAGGLVCSIYLASKTSDYLETKCRQCNMLWIGNVSYSRIADSMLTAILLKTSAFQLSQLSSNLTTSWQCAYNCLFDTKQVYVLYSYPVKLKDPCKNPLNDDNSLYITKAKRNQSVE